MGCKPTISSALLFINNIFIYLFQRNRASNWGWVNSFEAAALNDQVATTVSMLEMDLTPAHFKGLSLHVVFMLIPMLHSHKREQHGEILTKLAEIADAGKLQAIVDEQNFSLEEAGKAHDRLASGQAMGKVVVSV